MLLSLLTLLALAPDDPPPRTLPMTPAVARAWPWSAAAAPPSPRSPGRAGAS